MNVEYRLASLNTIGSGIKAGAVALYTGDQIFEFGEEQILILNPMTSGLRKSRTLPPWKDLPPYTCVRSGAVSMLYNFDDWLFFGSEDGVFSLFKLTLEKTQNKKTAESFKLKNKECIYMMEARKQENTLKMWVLQKGYIYLLETKD